MSGCEHRPTLIRRMPRWGSSACQKSGTFSKDPGQTPTVCRSCRVASRLLRCRANPPRNETQGDAYDARACTLRIRRGAPARSRRVSRDARPSAVGAASAPVMGPGCRTMRGTPQRSGRCEVSVQDARRGFHEGRTHHDGESGPAFERTNSRSLMRRPSFLFGGTPASRLARQSYLISRLPAVEPPSTFSRAADLRVAARGQPSGRQQPGPIDWP